MSYKSLYKLYVMNDSSTFNKLYRDKFNSQSTIKFDLTIDNNQAFFSYDTEIMKLVSKIRELDFELSKLIDKLPNNAVSFYIQNSLIEEIEYTNEIEGVKMNQDFFLSIGYELKIMNKIKTIFEGIIYKYVNLSNNDIVFLDSKDIRKLFDEMLFQEIKEEDSSNLPDGLIFRKETVHVYKSNDKIIHNGILPETRIIDYINKSLNILNDSSIDILIRISLFHYLFGYIHPFYDGNGRINRFITSYYLSRYFNNIIGYRLSLSIKQNISKYLKAFEETNDPRNKGDLSTFVYDFLSIIYQSFLTAKIDLEEKLKTLREFEDCIQVFTNKHQFKTKNQIIQLLNILVQNTIYSNIGLTKKELCAILNYGNTMMSEFLGILKHYDLIIDTNIQKHHYYKINLITLKKLC